MEEKKLTRIPLVRATEAGKAHIVNLHGGVLMHVTLPNCGLQNGLRWPVTESSPLEKGSSEGETPVHAL